LGVSFAFIVIHIAVLGFIMYLISFHVWINIQGFSTFEFVIWSRMKREKLAFLKVTIIFLSYFRKVRLASFSINNGLNKTILKVLRKNPKLLLI
jgi:hypothetical protein